MTRAELIVKNLRQLQADLASSVVACEFMIINRIQRANELDLSEEDHDKLTYKVLATQTHIRSISSIGEQIDKIITASGVE